MAYRIDTRDALPQPATPGWTCHALPPALGDCRAERFNAGDGLALARSHYHPLGDLVEDSAADDSGTPGTLVVTLGLCGSSGFVSGDGTALRFAAGHTTLAAFHGPSRGERRYAGGQPVRQLRLLVSGSALERYAGPPLLRRLGGQHGVRQLDHRPTPPSSLTLARRLLQPPGDHPTDALDRHIAMLSLLALELRHLAPAEPPDTRPARWPDADLARLERARDLLAAQMDRTLTVAYVAAAVGMNMHRLKQGFHAVFHTTPQQLLLELRMRRAWQLLEGGCQVAQAARQVGYAQAGNFSVAFTRFYGRNPKTVFGRRS